MQLAVQEIEGEQDVRYAKYRFNAKTACTAASKFWRAIRATLCFRRSTRVYECILIAIIVVVLIKILMRVTNITNVLLLRGTSLSLNGITSSSSLSSSTVTTVPALEAPLLLVWAPVNLAYRMCMLWHFRVTCGITGAVSLLFLFGVVRIFP